MYLHNIGTALENKITFNYVNNEKLDRSKKFFMATLVLWIWTYKSVFNFPVSGLQIPVFALLPLQQESEMVCQKGDENVFVWKEIDFLKLEPQIKF